MASEARWQTSTVAAGDGSFSEEGRTGHDAPSFSEDRAPWNKPLNEPLNQHMVGDLLQRLVDRFEESERLYGEAIEELHSRLDRLSHNKNAAEPAVADSFDRLHAQVRDLAERFEPETTTLENFERLGKALAGRGDTGDTAPVQSAAEPSPFAKSIMGLETPLYSVSALGLEQNLEEDLELPPFTPAYTPQAIETEARPAFDTRLVDMAAKLEQSIDTAMPTGAVEALNARLDAIGHKIAEAVDGAPSRATLEHVESHIAGMGRQLAHAEAQLGKIGSVEEHLRKLIVRLDEKDADLDPARIASEQAQDIAARAAGNAARLVADDTQKTTERLDAMQRELTEIGQTSRLSGDKVISTLEAVNDSLNQLARQVENTASSRPKPHPSHTAADEIKTPLVAAPADTPSPAVLLDDTDKRPAVEYEAATSVIEPAAEQRQRPTPVFKETGADDNTAREALNDEALLNAAPDDLVAAARQAAQAAAARAEERAEQRSKRSSGRPAHNEQPASRWRPLLIITAAGLLVVSAVLLYGRLGTKTGPVQAPAATSPSAPSATPAPKHNENRNTAVPKGQAPGPVKNQQQPAPDRGSGPANGATGQVGKIEVGQILDPSIPNRLASGVALPPGVALSTDDLSERAGAPQVQNR